MGQTQRGGSSQAGGAGQVRDDVVFAVAGVADLALELFTRTARQVSDLLRRRDLTELARDGYGDLKLDV